MKGFTVGADARHEGAKPGAFWPQGQVGVKSAPPDGHHWAANPFKNDFKKFPPRRVRDGVKTLPAAKFSGGWNKRRKMGGVGQGRKSREKSLTGTRHGLY